MRCIDKVSCSAVRQTIYIFFAAVCCLGGMGCSTRSIVKQNYNFSRIQRIAVLNFSGSGGSAVSNEFIRQFLSSGINVIDATDSVGGEAVPPGVDAVVSGSVVEFNPSNKFLVFKETDNIVIQDRMLPISGTTVMPAVGAFGMENAEVFSISASVTVYVKMVDASTREVIWSDSKSYEGLDINTAVEMLVKSMKNSLKPYWEGLR